MRIAAMSTPHQEFSRRLRAREPMVGYWCVLDAPVATERVSRLGYDYVAIDMQHGLVGYAGLLAALTAVDAGGVAVGLARVGENAAAPIGRVLDAGAVGVIVPLIDAPSDAARAVEAARYSGGRRSYGPMRSGLRIGPTPADADEAVAVIVMIETAAGLEHIEDICRVPGVDGVYVGPSDLRLALGGATSTDPSVDDAFEAALRRVADIAAAHGLAAGIHTPTGDVAARRLAQGFTFASVASDLTHLEIAAREHLEHASEAADHGR
jgi:4-hydroxy-2-oxoheptanedioate aldolase